jgi:type I restriction enzyme S subunit
VLVVEDETFVGRQIPFTYLIRGKSWVNNHAHILRACTGLYTEFLNYSLSYYPFTPLTTGSTGRRKLTQKALMDAPYALPPEDEQLRIIAEIERRLSVDDDIQQTLKRTSDRAVRLRQSVLRSAFEGSLVPQDPADEPASAILARIRAERSASSRPSPTRRTREKFANA